MRFLDAADSDLYTAEDTEFPLSATSSATARDARMTGQASLLAPTADRSRQASSMLISAFSVR